MTSDTSDTSKPTPLDTLNQEFLRLTNEIVETSDKIKQIKVSSESNTDSSNFKKNSLFCTLNMIRLHLMGLELAKHIAQELRVDPTSKTPTPVSSTTSSSTPSPDWNF